MPSVEDIINQYGPAQHLSLAELEAGLAKVHASPKDGALELIGVRLKICVRLLMRLTSI
ncbi:MAG: hypothetical protein R2865_11445 [Deinococcales bacterium]